MQLKQTQDPNAKPGYAFTSESVSEGHTDKICDQISDAVLDAYLRVDPDSRVACETLATTNRIILAGEILSRGSIDVEEVVRNTIRDIGYTEAGLGFDDSCTIDNHLHPLGEDLRKLTGAGDQGMMFGYACTQTENLMPLPIELAHRLLQGLATQRKNGAIPHILPDAKSQVTVRYLDRKAIGLEHLILSVHHRPVSKLDFESMREAIAELVIFPLKSAVAMESGGRIDTSNCRVTINPTGFWTQGGPAYDAGLTGRKTMVDTYGGWISHGGGAFSGKDASKVDRSGAYMARHIAKSVVASDLAEECLIQLGYVIDEQQPVSMMVQTFGSGKIPDREMHRIIQREFDLGASSIIDLLRLREPVYLPTAAYGHFGRDGFSWERTKTLVS